MTARRESASRQGKDEEARGTTCGNCAGSRVRVFYRTGDVPVHSCRMLADAEAAMSFPRRPVELGFCPECGHVSNTAYDPVVNEYAQGYEDQQSYSPRFREFQTQLAARLIDRYGLRGLPVVEVGCGKGDFLREFCRQSGAAGIGIDPRCSAGENNPDNGLQFIPEPFRVEHGRLGGTMLCCRHTLEHLPEPDRFVADIRKAWGSRPGGLVFFEVPDATRIWQECAFWDVYYEHCSYFTPASLDHVFRRNRFEILELDRVFDDQYLIIVARPGDRADTLAGLAPQHGPADVSGLLELFSIAVEAAIRNWRIRIARWTALNRKIAIWGAGSKCVAFISTLNAADAVSAIVDINPHQQGRFLPGIARRISPPGALGEERPDVVIVMNPAYRDEIAKELAEMGVVAEIACVSEARLDGSVG